jgi:hypothetical protein
MRTVPVQHIGLVRGSWHLGFDFTEIDGRLECVGINIRSLRTKLVIDDAGQPQVEYRPPLGGRPEPVTASLIRQIPVAFLVREAREGLGDVARWQASQPGRSAAERRTLSAVADQLDESPRRVLDDDHFAQVAEIYREAWAAGDPAPTKAVAERMKASRSAAAKWVARARVMGLLGETKQGRPGGTPPAKKTTTRRKRS